MPARAVAPRLTLLLLVAVACTAAPRTGGPHFGVVVYGGTSAGVMAAVQARRMGQTALLIEPTAHLGGMSSNGLGATDIGNKRAIGGLAREFYRAVRAHYADDAAWTWQPRSAFRGGGHRDDDDAAWTFEPHVAEAIFDAFCRDHDVAVWRGERLLRTPGGVTMDGNRIAAIRMQSGRSVAAAMFLDASYEGDLMAAAGVRYRIGREAAAEFGESLAGVRTELADKHQFVVDVDPFVVPGDPGSGLLPGVHDGGPGAEGGGDDRVQAYCLRLCATDVASNRVPWPRPTDYDERDYELLLRNFEAGDDRRPWHPVPMPNGKTDSNNNFAVSTDLLGGSRDWAEADSGRRAAIAARHRRWTAGLLWTLANHPRVPAAVRAHFAAFGLARDEFADTDHWPRLPYVREARRLVGELVMHEGHCRGTVRADCAIGLGAYGMDSHNVQRYVDARGFCRNEGDVQVHGFLPYPIGYDAILPRAAECANLLVPVCVSATHIAFGSIRMEPVFMVLGQSAATAACLALDRSESLHTLDRAALRRRLLQDSQVLDWPPQ